MNTMIEDAQVTEANKILKSLGKRIKIKKLIKKDYDGILFETTSYKRIFFMMDKYYGKNIVKAIILQKDIHRPYAFLCNGHASKNCTNVYHLFWNENLTIDGF